MIARVLLVGDELLGGTIVDVNAGMLARALAERGVPVAGVETVGDDEEAIADALARLAPRTDLLFATGGLGPTEDDVTREGFARALGVPLVEDAAARAAIEERLAARGIERPAASVARQARRPAGTEIVENPLGTAPGFSGTLGRCRFWALPGVPPEAESMAGAVSASLPGPRPGWAWQRIVATAGRGEVRVAQRLASAGFVPPAGVRLAFLPGAGGVRLRLWGGAPAEELDRAAARLREILGAWALPAATVQESLVGALAAAGKTIATAESCTGGLVGARITDVPGASSVYLGGIVSYSDRAKIERLGVDPGLLAAHGAVSEPVARALAEGVRGAFGADLAVSVTGIAGPGGGTPEKPAGTVWIAVADGRGTEATRFLFPGSRAMVRERTVNKALEMAYRRGEEPPP